MSLQQMISNILVNLAFKIFNVLVFSLIACFFWNIGVLWMAPHFPEMSFLVSVALNSGFMVIHMTVIFWHNKILRLKAMDIAILEMKKSFWGGETNGIED
jgi:hypothetical protein